MANTNGKIENLKKKLAAVESKINALTAERKALKDEIKAAEDAQLVELIRTAAPEGDTADLAQDFAAFMRAREAQSSEAPASGARA